MPGVHSNRSVEEVLNHVSFQPQSIWRIHSSFLSLLTKSHIKLEAANFFRYSLQRVLEESLEAGAQQQQSPSSSLSSTPLSSSPPSLSSSPPSSSLSSPPSSSSSPSLSSPPSSSSSSHAIMDCTHTTLTLHRLEIASYVRHVTSSKKQSHWWKGTVNGVPKWFMEILTGIIWNDNNTHNNNKLILFLYSKLNINNYFFFVHYVIIYLVIIVI